MRNARGFSLIELIMVIVVFGIIAVVAAPLISNAVRAFVTGRDIAETDWQARVAVERMTRELRTIRAPADLTITSASVITFIDVNGTAIRYCQATIGTCPGALGELMRNTEALASGISGLTFSYLTRAGAVTAVPAQVFYVTVAFTATQNAISKTFQVSVGPRNFP